MRPEATQRFLVILKGILAAWWALPAALRFDQLGQQGDDARAGNVSAAVPMQAHFILYVADQQRSAQFYAHVLGRTPRLDVPGMTEFQLGEDAVLGLMPVSGIKRLLGDALPDPASAAGIPRAELYLMVDDPRAHHDRAVAHGARQLSALAARDWGHDAAYSLDADGHVLAFAKVSAAK